MRIFVTSDIHGNIDLDINTIEKIEQQVSLNDLW